jgi:RNA-directed DNA polymerase
LTGYGERTGTCTTSLDLWADWWRERFAHGDVIIVRFADDFIIGFEEREYADRFLAELRERFAKFSLEQPVAAA